MKGLLKLYPPRWRQRYGDELLRLLDDLRPMSWRASISVGIDLFRGAIDAHLSMEPRVKTQTRAALRRGTIVGLAVSAVLSVAIVLSNVVFPSAGDADGLNILLSYVGIFGALCYTGVLAARVTTRRRDLAMAGAVAGALIAAFFFGTFIAIDNVFLDIVSRKQSKIDGLAQSGMTSMRAYLTASMVGALLVATPVLTLIGAGLATMFGSSVRQPTLGGKSATVS